MLIVNYMTLWKKVLIKIMNNNNDDDDDEGVSLWEKEEGMICFV